MTRNPFFLDQRTADDLDRAFFRQIDQAARDGRYAEIHVAGGNRHRHRLRRLEILELDFEAFLGEIAALECDETRRVRGKPQRADRDLVGGGGHRRHRGKTCSRERTGGNGHHQRTS